jgi:hypothetical protein
VICSTEGHREAKQSPRLAAECEFIGVQTDVGFEDLYLVNCPHCHSTLAVRRSVWLLSVAMVVGIKEAA